MDSSENPYMPGAGTPPPELAGRQVVISTVNNSFKRVAGTGAAEHSILVGLRGVGKTVLLNTFEDLAEDAGLVTIYIEATDNKSLAEMLVPRLRSVLVKLSKSEKAKAAAMSALSVLKSFVTSVKMDIGGYEFGMSIHSEEGVADSGDLESDLPELMLAVGKAAKAAETPLAIFVDEIQYLTQDDLSALITSIHRTNQKKYPIIFNGAGLPQILALAGNSRSYTERMFKFPPIGKLDIPDARAALEKPALSKSVEFADEAVDEILDQTQGYPYFVQQWGYECWNVAQESTITLKDVHSATPRAVAELDQSFFRVRLDRCTPSEQRYMKALARLGAGSHRSNSVAEELGIAVTSASPHRSSLIKKGMVFSPSHGDTEFTVPLFHEFMEREFDAED